MTVPVIHPRFVAAIDAGFFPSLVTIEEKTGTTLDELGQETETWSPVLEVSAAKAPLTAQERQATNYTATDQAWSVLLSGTFPSITTSHRAVIDDVIYDIDAAETDQTGHLTRLRIRNVEV